MPVPQGVWQDISLDFIDGLPLSDSKNVILVVVDRFTKYNHFIPLKHPSIFSQVAAVVDNVVFKTHGILRSIVSNRDRIFLRKFWHEPFAVWKTKLKLNE